MFGILWWKKLLLVVAMFGFLLAAIAIPHAFAHGATPLPEEAGEQRRPVRPAAS